MNVEEAIEHLLDFSDRQLDKNPKMRHVICVVLTEIERLRRTCGEDGSIGMKVLEVKTLDDVAREGKE